MRETKFTPWRWEFDGDTDRVRVYATTAENPLREELVCDVGNYGSDVEQMEAWGALIAAAPALYAALLALADDYATISPKYHNTDVYAAARAALGACSPQAASESGNVQGVK